MAPHRIMFIRHAEKPDAGNAGVAADGAQDDESLTVRGWQRAGALAKFFASQPALRPGIVFAAGVGPGSKSKRPSETVTPLVNLLNAPGITSHLKSDLQPLIDDVMTRDGTVLVAWEHQLIPDMVGLLPNAPAVPQHWPGDRFDIVWILDRAGSGWSFSQVPQLLLAGDSASPIS
jgi:broad specificity phosphatase PhoE